MFNHQLQLTPDQQTALEKIRVFVDSEIPVFIMYGYAGTGKTTLLKILAEELRGRDRQVSCMAPTGRATKVLRDKTGLETSTVHSGIYNYFDLKEVKVADEEEGDSFLYFFDLKDNHDIRNQIFIVDESSMLSDETSEGEFFRFGSGRLLSDLISFTRIQHPEANNKLIFVGDPAQLSPPTHGGLSPALSAGDLMERFNLRSDSSTLTQIVRQEGDSGILNAAVLIRKGIESAWFNQFQVPANGKDIDWVETATFFEQYKAAPGKKIIITYTNQTAYEINMDLRRKKYGGEFPIQIGDIMLVGQNNHLTGLFNGEFGVINRCELLLESREVVFKVAAGQTERITLNWRKIDLAYLNQEGLKATMNSYMLENFLHNKTNNLKSEEQQALYIDFKNRNSHLKPGSFEFKESLRRDPFFNALKLKYGYAVTCHKAQGGEWNSAFVIWDYARPVTFNAWSEEQKMTGRNNADFFRWAYTAITRASEHLYCINPPHFTPYKQMAFINLATASGLQHLNGEGLQPEYFQTDQSMTEALSHWAVPAQPETIRNHFLSVLHQCRSADIEIAGWKQSGFEFTYTFRQGDRTASVKGWVKGDGSFNPNYMKNPGATNSEDLFVLTQRFCQNHGKFQPEFTQAHSGSASAYAASDWSIAEQMPFLQQLYLDLQDKLAAHHITIDQVEHLYYRERYTFVRIGEKAVVDAIYNALGFFTCIQPLSKPAPAATMLHDLETVFLQLKNL